MESFFALSSCAPPKCHSQSSISSLDSHRINCLQFGEFKTAFLFLGSNILTFFGLSGPIFPSLQSQVLNFSTPLSFTSEPENSFQTHNSRCCRCFSLSDATFVNTPTSFFFFIAYFNSLILGCVALPISRGDKSLFPGIFKFTTQMQPSESL